MTKRGWHVYGVLMDISSKTRVKVVMSMTYRIAKFGSIPLINIRTLLDNFPKENELPS